MQPLQAMHEWWQGLAAPAPALAAQTLTACLRHTADGFPRMLTPHQACLPRATDGTPISSQVVWLMLGALAPPMPAPAGLLVPPHHCSPSLAQVVWRLVAPPYAVGVPLRLPPHVSPAGLQREITMKANLLFGTGCHPTASPLSWTTGIVLECLAAPQCTTACWVTAHLPSVCGIALLAICDCVYQAPTA